jgi:hypothetical protein
LKKYYPYGWRFYQKPGGLELYFLETGTYLYFLLFIFYFLFQLKKLLLKKEAKNADEIDEVLRKGYKILKQKKKYKIYSDYFSALKFYTLSYC